MWRVVCRSWLEFFCVITLPSHAELCVFHSHLWSCTAVCMLMGRRTIIVGCHVRSVFIAISSSSNSNSNYCFVFPTCRTVWMKVLGGFLTAEALFSNLHYTLTVRSSASIGYAKILFTALADVFNGQILITAIHLIKIQAQNSRQFQKGRSWASLKS